MKINSEKIADAALKNACTPSEIILEIGATRDALMKVFELDADTALNQAIKFVGKFYGVNLKYEEKKPTCTYTSCPRYTAEDIARKMGTKTRKINRRLIAEGLQYRNDDGDYILTARGNRYGEYAPFGDKILWNDDVIKILDESFLNG